jgi:hypothetical protein
VVLTSWRTEIVDCSELKSSIHNAVRAAETMIVIFLKELGDMGLGVWAWLLSDIATT